MEIDQTEVKAKTKEELCHEAVRRILKTTYGFEIYAIVMDILNDFEAGQTK